MKNENLIHVKFEYEEAINAKKDLLQTEIALLKIAKIMKTYQVLRKNEVKIKTKLLSKLRGTTTNFKKLQSNLPKNHLFKRVSQTPKFKSPKKETKYDKEIEDQLLEIQQKLATLQ